jgi:hypothetical protein
MSSFAPSRPRLRHAVLLGAMALALLGPTGAQARVGVTSVTDGDPLGKPPAEPERILRIGLDIQANEAVTTGNDDRAHLVLLDGTSLTVGPNARLVIDKFIYDPATQTGERAVNASKGVLRLVGGKISKKEPITITTPSSTIGVRGGITILDVQPTQTTSTFVFGDRMTVTGQGLTQTATRPGSQVITNSGTPPTPPALVGQGGLSAQMNQLEGRTGGRGNRPASAVGASSTVIVSGTQGLASQSAQRVPGGNPINAAASFLHPQQWNPTTYLNPAAFDPPAYNAGSSTGMPSSFSLPNTGSATYAGSFSGADSGGATFGGNFSLGWSFASQTGLLSATGTGRNSGTATAPLSLIRGTVAFTGPLTVTNILGGNSGNGTVSGRFVSASGSPIGGVAGTFSGTGNSGSTFNGAFSGHR